MKEVELFNQYESIVKEVQGIFETDKDYMRVRLWNDKKLVFIYENPTGMIIAVDNHKYSGEDINAPLHDVLFPAFKRTGLYDEMSRMFGRRNELPKILHDVLCDINKNRVLNIIFKPWAENLLRQCDNALNHRPWKWITNGKCKVEQVPFSFTL